MVKRGHSWPGLKCVRLPLGEQRSQGLVCWFLEECVVIFISMFVSDQRVGLKCADSRMSFFCKQQFEMDKKKRSEIIDLSVHTHTHYMVLLRYFI